MANVGSRSGQYLLLALALTAALTSGCGSNSPNSATSAAGGSGTASGGAGGKSEPTSASSSGADTVCGKFAASLKACSLIPAGGDFGCSEPQTPQSACEKNCLLAASCAELTTAVCASVVDAPDLMTCVTACANQFALDCGNGETYQASGRCNGTASCSNKADEADCGEFTCKSGESVARALTCNQHRDCNDGSDELGCATYVCEDNTNYIRAEFHCDGELDCLDGSDEVGCPTTTCATGEVIFAYKRCDAVQDCRDMSDEAGCLGTLAEVLTCPEPTTTSP